MAYLCYVCDESLPTISALSFHFKVYHNFSCSNKYYCKQNNCFRIFDSLHTFKKHLKRKHDANTSPSVKKRSKRKHDHNTPHSSVADLHCNSQIPLPSASNIVDRNEDQRNSSDFSCEYSD